MTRNPRPALVAASILFLVLSTASNLGIATLYARSLVRLAAAAPIGDRGLRLLARPIRIQAGQALGRAALEQHLQRIGYYPSCGREPGCYERDDGSMTIWARYPELSDVTVRWDGDRVRQLETPAGETIHDALIEPETVLTVADDPVGASSHTSQDPIPFRAIAGTTLIDAVLSSEDRWFQTHHGIDLPRLVAVPFVGGGASTITMQVARLNVLQDRSWTLRRKLNELGTAMAIERLYSKEAILTTYVNSVYVGASRGRSVQGFGAAAREFFGVHDVRQLTGLQAATLAALLNQPSRYLDDFRRGDDSRLRKQRNRVLRLMQKNFPQRYSAAWVRRQEPEPVVLASPPDASDDLHRSSRHFLDYVAPAARLASTGRVYLTLDPALQRIALDATEQGLTALERQVRSATGRVQAALIATNPQTGHVLAMVGGRSYDQSQFNRAVNAERQIGSLMKPFDYLAAFERAAAEGRTDISPNTLVVDEPTTFTFPGVRPWTPANYGHDYAGRITWRRALAESRNVPAVKIAGWAGINNVARFWEAAAGQQLPAIFPSLALGAIEATPAQVAGAYAIFATGGIAPLLQTETDAPTVSRRIARADTTRLVTAMMRAVLNEGTGRGVRAAGFTADAAGKTGTTDGLRDAWFVGFTSDLLAVVWVGLDDGQPLGLTGAQAALPLWTAFMKRATEEVPR